MPDLGETVQKQKRPRTQAQIDAFEKARKTREDNLRKKFKAEQEAQSSSAVKSDEPVIEHEVALPPEPESEEPESEEPESEEEVAQDKSVAKKPAKRAASRETVAAHIDDEFIDFDPEAFRSEFFGKLDEAHNEIAQLKEHISGLNNKHEELQTSWQKHGVRTSNMLNFV